MDVYPHLEHMKKMLKNLDAWIGKAVEHAAARPFDVDTLAHARLAPDQFPLTRQVQSACDAAKFTHAYLAGKPAPSHPDTETTIAELRQRIATVVEHLDSYTAEDFVGVADRVASPMWLRGKSLKAVDYLVHAGIPNFFFHVTTAYAIMRHNGVPLGKQDYLGGLPPFV